MGETSASAKNWEPERCWRVFPEAKGRFPIIRSNLLEGLPGSSKAYDMANCPRFLYFSFPLHDTLQMESVEFSLFLS